jgi:AraC-like DNA-binding protein
VNRSELLHETADLSVSRFDHPPHEPHADPERETSDHWGVAFVRAGSFGVVGTGADCELSRGGVFLSRPGFEFGCVHGDECPDDVCLAIRFEAPAVAQLEHAWERSRWMARPAATPRLAYVARRLETAAEERNEFEMERWSLAAVGALASDADVTLARGRYAARTSDADAVAEACRDIEHDAASRRHIADRARAVGLTSTQLTHAFRRYVGVSPHQYVIRWRLGDAADLLEGGATTTDACYRSGFENLSHFCRTFQRVFGVRASAWARLPLAERRRKVQDLVRGAA